MTGTNVPTNTLSENDVSLITNATSKAQALTLTRKIINELGYTIVDTDEVKPWGGFYRLADNEAERFINNFFPGLSLEEAKLGNPSVELSPKFLLVCPSERLSWQYHFRRAERWSFLTSGAYCRSDTDQQGERIEVDAGTVVQFKPGERHRLCSFDDKSYTLVAEIWQHTDPTNPSNEDDIVRVADDYKRY